ncbi:MAG TPA: thioredoxin-like domain-containing protein [Tepidisphaeraceae bacterium]|nr:thioredoxin-like domain-containing protein [Tepidisphaeraceae bacterium]
MTHRLIPLLALMLALPARGIDPAMQGKAAGPEFPAELEWLNTDKPLKLADFRGKFVLLDFWTYCCINCIHVIPDLHKLEEKYPNELVVIGVHSAKFTTEQESSNIREAILRYEITHPVINDKSFDVWNAYDAKGWPTFVLIDPEGKILRKKSGEGIFAQWDPVIGDLIKAWDAEKKIDRRPMKFALEKDKAPKSLLAFPGKIAASGKWLAISDSNHNRILILDAASGKVEFTIGEGSKGLVDGSFSEAKFHQPQGVAFDPAGEKLYVADTENHAVREVDLVKKVVRTLAGSGKQATRTNVPGVGRDVALASPWDLLVHKDHLYVAMAGPHQIWRIELGTGAAEPFAGSSRENLKDGPLADAQLAQPSGIVKDPAGTTLYFADSEISAIRTADLDPKGQVKTLIGKGLFDFGDKDGPFADALLQHPLGVLFYEGDLLIADTYNNKVKRLDLKNKTISTLIGTGKGGYKDGPADQAMLNEPNGLALAGGKLYVADTNNHAIRVYDFASKNVSTLKITGLETMTKATHKTLSGPVTTLPAQRVAAGDAEIVIDVALPKGHKLNGDAPLYVGLSTPHAEIVSIPADAADRNIKDATLPIRTKVKLVAGATTLNVDLVVYYCEAGENEGLCLVKPLRLEVPLEVVAGAGEKVVTVKAEVK